MVVHSDCSIALDENGHNIITDVVSFDWRRVDTVVLEEVCKS